jgi:hypothetical protein
MDELLTWRGLFFKYIYLFKCPILGLLFGIIKQLLPSLHCKHQNCYPSRGCFTRAKALGKTTPQLWCSPQVQAIIVLSYRNSINYKIVIPEWKNGYISGQTWNITLGCLPAAQILPMFDRLSPLWRKNGLFGGEQWGLYMCIWKRN